MIEFILDLWKFRQEWRNWQTRKIQGLVGENPWGFKSLLLHYLSSREYFPGFPI